MRTLPTDLPGQRGKEDDRRLATAAIEGLRSKRDEAISRKETTSSPEEVSTSDRKQPAPRQKGEGVTRFNHDIVMLFGWPSRNK